MAQRRGPRKPAASPVKPRSSDKVDVIVTIVGPESDVAINAMLVGPTGWRRRHEDLPTFGDEFGTYVTMGDPGDDRVRTAQIERRAWDLVLELDDVTALTFMYVTGRYLQKNTDPTVKRPVRIHVNELLEWMGYARNKTGDFQQRDKIDARRRVATLCNIWLTRTFADSAPPKRQRRSRRKVEQTVSVSSSLMNVTYYSKNDGEKEKLPYLELPGTGTPYEFEIDLGAWATPYIEAGNFRGVFAKILSYAPREGEQRIQVRLALFMHFHVVTVARVGDLLKNAHIDLPSHHPERFRDAVENALDRLAADGLIGKWEYTRTTELPRYRWLDEWIAWEISLAPTAIKIETAPRRVLSENATLSR